jgi:REP-associated tyrosine transposase
MARGARWAIANALYHVMNRGVERRDIVGDDKDRQEWMRLLNRVAHRCEWRVFAHVLLDNHFHLFLRTAKPNLSEGMHDLQSGYATLFNQRHERTGHLFQGRFKSILVESEGHAWVLSRYVHLNPVRANLTRDPAAYPWSSYRFFLNPHGAPLWLDWRAVFAEFSQKESAARIAYKRFVEAGLPQPPVSPFRDVVDGWLLGSAAFVDQMRREYSDDPNDPGSAGPKFNSARAARDASNIHEMAKLNFEPPDPWALLNAVATTFDVTTAIIQKTGCQNHAAREAVVWLLRELLHEPVSTIGKLLGGVGKSTISEAFRRAVARRNQDETFRKRLDEVRDSLFPT